MAAKEIFRYQENPASPLISFKLWSDATFVNFEKKTYVTYCVDRVQDLDILHERGYTAIDTAIADTIMRLNCMPGCSTRTSCSGHPGDYRSAYIWFSELPDDLAEYLSKSGMWERDQDGFSNTWRAHGITEGSTSEWLAALKYLADYPGLPENGFQQIHVISEPATGSNGEIIEADNGRRIYMRTFYTEE